jgi:hypothetical protein
MAIVAGSKYVRVDALFTPLRHLHGALKIQVQHYRERMLHGKKLQAVEH